MRRLTWYGWLGLIIVVGAEALLFAGQPFVAQWFTPIVWTGYILLADAVALRLRGHSLLHDRPRTALMMAWISVGCWLLFEIYNFKLWNWYYVGLPERPLARNWAYLWSFATIMPGMFETVDVLEGLGFARRLRSKRRALSPVLLAAMFVVGLAFVAIPPVLPYRLARYTFGFVWIGFILLLEPINMQLGVDSPLQAWAEGNPRPALRLLAAGLFCGFLWEFWNFWATSGWRYTVPWPLDLDGPANRLHYFRMPLLGMLGFPPFAWESWAMFQFLKRALRGDVLWD
jgi:hypothetical protein